VTFRQVKRTRPAKIENLLRYTPKFRYFIFDKQKQWAKCRTDIIVFEAPTTMNNPNGYSLNDVVLDGTHTICRHAQRTLLSRDGNNLGLGRHEHRQKNKLKFGSLFAYFRRQTAP
jgi:hypothetical protein